MIHTNRFAASGRLFAFDLSTLSETPHEGAAPRSRWTVDSVWVRRKNRRTVVSMGTVKLWGQRIWLGGATPPGSSDPYVVLDHPWDGRYGGDALASWDGESFWTSDPRPPVSGPRLDFLRQFLDGVPNLPDGYTGWWKFDA